MSNANTAILRNERGVTLLEIMFALGILIVGTYLTVEGTNQMSELAKDTRTLSTTDRQITAIVENLRTNLGSFQITYDYSPKVKQDALKLENLPMAWDSGVVRPVSDCKTATKDNCPAGRYGYVIQPLSQYRGLYAVTLRMTHREWKEPYRDYEFLVTVQ